MKPEHKIMAIEDYQKMPVQAIRRVGGVQSKYLQSNKMDNQHTPMVSVITVVLNGAEHLEKTVQSVLRQKYADMEYIIIDGGSTDGTLEIIGRYEDKVDLWISEPDKGIYDGMNKGIALSRGKFIKLLNSDDVLLDSAVERVADETQKLDGANCIITSYMNVVTAKGCFVCKVEGESKRVLWWSDMKAHPSWYVPRGIYQEHGLYSLDYRIASDREFYYRAKTRGVQFHTIREALVEFRLGGVSSTGLTGAIESYAIHVRYIGHSRALAMFLQQYLGKCRANILKYVIGEKCINAVRIKWHQGFRVVRANSTHK